MKSALPRQNAGASQAGAPEPDVAGRAGPASHGEEAGVADPESTVRRGRLVRLASAWRTSSRGRRTAAAIVVATAILIVALVAGVSIGPVGVPLGEIADTLISHLPWHPAVSVQPIDAAIIWQIRLPRVVLGALVGSMLAGGGAAYQGVFRNPLADPYLLGVAAGAGLGATAVIISGGSLALLPVAAFAGGVAAVGLTYSLGAGARRRADDAGSAAGPVRVARPAPPLSCSPASPSRRC